MVHIRRAEFEHHTSIQALVKDEAEAFAARSAARALAPSAPAVRAACQG